MRYEFEVGSNEKHKIIYQLNDVMGGCSISVDGKPIEGDRPKKSFLIINLLGLLIGASPNATWYSPGQNMFDFFAGNEEKHHIRIQRLVQPGLTFFNDICIEVHVDSEPVQEIRYEIPLWKKIVSATLIMGLFYLGFRLHK